MVNDQELMALSVFELEDGVVYHTYTCYDRGTDVLNTTWQLLDRTPKGRDEGAVPGGRAVTTSTTRPAGPLIHQGPAADVRGRRGHAAGPGRRPLKAATLPTSPERGRPSEHRPRPPPNESTPCGWARRSPG